MLNRTFYRTQLISHPLKFMHSFMHIEMYIAINHKIWQVEWSLFWDIEGDLSVFIPDFWGRGGGEGAAMDTPEKNDHVRQKMFWHFKLLILGYVTRTYQICYCRDERTGLCSTFPCLSGMESSSSDCLPICAQSQTLSPDSPDQPGTAVAQWCCTDCGLCTSLKGLLPGWSWTAFAPGGAGRMRQR